MIKRLRKIIPIIMLISIGLGIIQTKEHFVVQGVLPIDSYIGETLKWEINTISEGNNEWWNWTSTPTPTFKENWHASVNDSVNLTITDSKIINDKAYIEGDFMIGNLSLTTNNYDIGTNLAISCYPWVGGVVALEENWNILKNQSPFNETTASILTNLSIYFNGTIVEGVMIEYDNGFQTSSFYYEQNTGILLSAQTVAASYSLTMFLNESSIIIPPKISTNITGFTPVIIMIGCLSLLVLKKKRK